MPSLRAAGFCKLEIGGAYPDASAYLGGALHVTFSSSTPGYAGFKVAFTAPGIARRRWGPGSFMADLAPPAAAASGLVTVRVPFGDFSSDHAGPCRARPSTCPSAAQLARIQGLELWAEGVEGDFAIEIKEIAAGPA